MSNNKNWELDGERLTINVANPVTTKDLSEILNAVVNYERNNCSDYYHKYTNWNIEKVVIDDKIEKNE